MSGRPGDVLIQLCDGADQLLIVAPYIKADALSKVLAVVNAEASLICVTRWDPHDITVGASDVECRSLVIDSGGSFRLHSSLHAKFYRIDDVVLIGSANLTSSALGWSEQPNLEILCRAGPDFDACAFQQDLLADSREVSDAEFERWQAVERIEIRRGAVTGVDPPRVGAWRPATRDPRHLITAYQGNTGEIASFDEQRAAQRDIQALQFPPGLAACEIRDWASACLLAAPFTGAVMRVHDTEPPTAAQSLADAYGIGTTEARRDMETVLNWLSFFMPETVD